ncbi:MAG: methyltransferase domain-containing protein [Halodesulfurarchaeum sp.]
MGVLEHKSRARCFYRYLSKVYDRVNTFVFTDPMRAEALRMLDLDGDEEVLDVGCGTGFGTKGLVAKADSVFGLDQSPHQLAGARDKLEGASVSFSLGDAENLPFENDAFDAAWSSGSIEYWPNPVQGLREMHRVTRPGGRVLVVGPNYPASAIGQRLADAIMLFYDVEEAERMFEDAGFEETTHRTLSSRYKSDLAIASLGRVPVD